MLICGDFEVVLGLVLVAFGLPKRAREGKGGFGEMCVSLRRQLCFRGSSGPGGRPDRSFWATFSAIGFRASSFTAFMLIWEAFGARFGDFCRHDCVSRGVGVQKCDGQENT